MCEFLRLKERDAELKRYFQRVLEDVEKTFYCDVASFNMVLERDNEFCCIHHGSVIVKE